MRQQRCLSGHVAALFQFKVLRFILKVVKLSSCCQTCFVLAILIMKSGKSYKQQNTSKRKQIRTSLLLIAFDSEYL